MKTTRIKVRYLFINEYLPKSVCEKSSLIAFAMIAPKGRNYSQFGAYRDSVSFFKCPVGTKYR